MDEELSTDVERTGHRSGGRGSGGTGTAHPVDFPLSAQRLPSLFPWRRRQPQGQSTSAPTPDPVIYLCRHGARGRRRPTVKWPARRPPARESGGGGGSTLSYLVTQPFEGEARPRLHAGFAVRRKVWTAPHPRSGQVAARRPRNAKAIGPASPPNG